MDKQVIGVRLSSEIVKVIDKLAKQQDRTRSYIISRWLTERATSEGRKGARA